MSCKVAPDGSCASPRGKLPAGCDWGVVLSWARLGIQGVPAGVPFMCSCWKLSLSSGWATHSFAVVQPPFAGSAGRSSPGGWSLGLLLGLWLMYTQAAVALDGKENVSMKQVKQQPGSNSARDKQSRGSSIFVLGISWTTPWTHLLLKSASYPQALRLPRDIRSSWDLSEDWNR